MDKLITCHFDLPRSPQHDHGLELLKKCMVQINNDSVLLEKDYMSKYIVPLTLTEKLISLNVDSKYSSPTSISSTEIEAYRAGITKKFLTDLDKLFISTTDTYFQQDIENTSTIANKKTIINLIAVKRIMHKMYKECKSTLNIDVVRNCLGDLLTTVKNKFYSFVLDERSENSEVLQNKLVQSITGITAVIRTIDTILTPPAETEQ